MKSEAEVYKYIIKSSLGGDIQINIYIEAVSTNKGNLIISSRGVCYSRFFDGCSPDIKTFISNQSVVSISNCFASYRNSKQDWAKYELLSYDLKQCWDEFMKELKS